MMKPILHAISAFLILSVASSAALAYSGSECEVNDCSKPTKATASESKAQPRTKAEVKTEVKNAAKTEAKNKALENAPAPLRDVAGFFK
jgi:hypothetical protein